MKERKTRAGPAPGAAGDRAKPRGDRWDKIAQASAEIFHEKGYDAATLQEIADRVGILKGSIYYYINTKSDLLESLLSTIHDETLEMLQAAAAMPGSSFDRLGAVIRAQILYIARNPALTGVMLNEARRIEPARRREIIGDHHFRDVIQALVESGQAAGEIRADLDPVLTAQTILASVNSVHLWFRPRGRMTADVIAEHLVNVTIRGIAVPDTPPP